MYATTTTGHREHVTVNKSTKVLQGLNLVNTYCRLIQTTSTTTEEWRGLNYADAMSVCTSSETSTLNGVTRPYLGSAKLSVSSGGQSRWATIDGCWGTRISSQLSRMSDTNCYEVKKTTEVMTVTNYGGTMELL